MPWVQLHIQSDREHAELLEELLLEAGAEAVSMEDSEDTPLYEPERGTTPLWDSTTVTGLFQGDADLATRGNLGEHELVDVVRAELVAAGVVIVVARRIEDEVAVAAAEVGDVDSDVGRLVKVVDDSERFVAVVNTAGNA